MATVVASPKVECEALKRIVFGTAERMTKVQDGTANLVMMSPPYVGHHSSEEKEAEYNLTKNIFRECERIMVPGGVVGSYNTDFRDNGALYARHMVVIKAAVESGFRLIAQKIRVRTFKRDLYRIGYSFVLVFVRHGD